MDKERMRRIPEILVKSAKFVIRKPLVIPIVGSTVGTGLGITHAVLGGNPLISAAIIGVGVVGVGLGINNYKRHEQHLDFLKEHFHK